MTSVGLADWMQNDVEYQFCDKEYFFMNPLVIQQLKPVPLPRDLELLQNNVVEELAQSNRELLGFIKSLETFEQHREAVVAVLEDQITKLKEVVQILKHYKQTSSEIDRLLVEIHQTYQEYVNNETIQYQLLSSNFNQEGLKRKYMQLIQHSDQQSLQKAKNPGENLDEFLLDFRLARKQFHIRSEKLNRWNEERVTGFV